jgi:hypothetical protein
MGQHVVEPPSRCQVSSKRQPSICWCPHLDSSDYRIELPFRINFRQVETIDLARPNTLQKYSLNLLEYLGMEEFPHPLNGGDVGQLLIPQLGEVMIDPEILQGSGLCRSAVALAEARRPAWSRWSVSRTAFHPNYFVFLPVSRESTAHVPVVPPTSLALVDLVVTLQLLAVVMLQCWALLFQSSGENKPLSLWPPPMSSQGSHLHVCLCFAFDATRFGLSLEAKACVQ